MICHKTLTIEITEKDEIQTTGGECIKEKCSAWDKYHQRCIVLSILEAIQNNGAK